mmetsp:Transcript_6535/g.18218  ORF Transcript_6535/g.18218 Transcript_6535/m.18218 type:complete len:223 (-) Transcript_6535:60-728(-)
MLEQVLHDIVSVAVPAQSKCLCQELLHEIDDLVGTAILQQPLQHAATELVPRRSSNAPNAGAGAARAGGQELVDDELRGLRARRGDALLQHEIAIWAHQGLPDVALQLGGERFARHVIRGILQGALHLSAAVRAPRKLQHPAGDAATAQACRSRCACGGATHRLLGTTRRWRGRRRWRQHWRGGQRRGGVASTRRRPGRGAAGPCAGAGRLLLPCAPRIPLL